MPDAERERSPTSGASPPPRSMQAHVLVDVAPETALRAFVEPGLVREWWECDHAEIEAREGGRWEVGWRGTDGSFLALVSGTIARLDAVRLEMSPLSITTPDGTLADMRIEVDVIPIGNACRVRVTEANHPATPAGEAAYQAAVRSWPPTLARLKATLEAARSA